MICLHLGSLAEFLQRFNRKNLAGGLIKEHHTIKVKYKNHEKNVDIKGSFFYNDFFSNYNNFFKNKFDLS